MLGSNIGILALATLGSLYHGAANEQNFELFAPGTLVSAVSKLKPINLAAENAARSLELYLKGGIVGIANAEIKSIFEGVDRITHS